MPKSFGGWCYFIIKVEYFRTNSSIFKHSRITDAVLLAVTQQAYHFWREIIILPEDHHVEGLAVPPRHGPAQVESVGRSGGHGLHGERKHT